MRISNRRAKAKYRIISSVEAGVVLDGGEVKSLRAGKADLTLSFGKIQSGEVWLKNVYIYPYFGRSIATYNPKRDRKLLLHRNQIDNLRANLSGGMALIPLAIYFKRNIAKVEVALARAKGKFDHRRAIKQRDEDRKLAREIAKYK